MAAHQLAQLNVARWAVDPDGPVAATFLDQLDEVNAVAEAADGFVWRLQDDSGTAIDVPQPFGDDCIVNLSVWRDIASLRAYAHGGRHRTPLRQRHTWFREQDVPTSVLWWVPAGHVPTVAEGAARLELLRAEGPTPAAFTFGRPFPPPADDEADDARAAVEAVPSPVDGVAPTSPAPPGPPAADLAAGIELPVPTDGLVVRPGTERDLPAVAAIYTHYVLNTTITFHTQVRTPLEWRDRYREHVADGPYEMLVAERDGAVVGFVETLPFRPKPAYFTSVELSIYVAPDDVGGGVGSALMRTLLGRLATGPFHRLFAIITLPNERSVRFHERHGFVHRGTLTEAGHKFDRYLDVAYFERALS